MSLDTGWVERIGHVAPTPPEVARDAGLTIVERFGRSDARPLLDMLGIPDAIAGAPETLPHEGRRAGR